MQTYCYDSIAQITALRCTMIHVYSCFYNVVVHREFGLVFMFRNIHTTDQELVTFSVMGAYNYMLVLRPNKVCRVDTWL